MEKDKIKSRKKVLILGDDCTGKSCIFVSATTNAFQQMYQKTVFEDYHYDVFIDTKLVNII
jgi:GTPase SAR1 family protein